MRRSRRQLDEWADRLAAPNQIPHEGDTVATFVGLLRSASAEDVVGRTQSVALAAEAQSVAENVPLRTTSARGSRPLTIRWRRRVVISTFLSTLFGKIAVGTIAVAVAATMTATGNLPGPAQQGVSDALSRIGVEVPAPNHASDGAGVDAADKPAVSHEPTGPVLPAQASDTAKAVTATVFGNDALTGRAFGKAVSAAAKGDAGSGITPGARATPAVPAKPAVPAVPAHPGGKGKRAVPAVPAKPAVPAIPATPTVPPSSH